jgi:hypothetical protein
LWIVISQDTLNNLEPRRIYLASSEEVRGDKPDGGRWMIVNVWQLDNFNVPVGVVQQPLAFYTDFIFQETNKVDRERVQVFPSSGDAGKSYFFDREYRQFVFQGLVYDVPYGIDQQIAGLISSGYSRFKSLYDACFRISQAAKKGLIIELDTDHFRLWGAMTNMTGTHAADSPTTYVITFGFWVEAMQVKNKFVAADNLFISREAAAKLDLIALEADANSAIPKLALRTSETRIPRLDPNTINGVEMSLRYSQLIYSDPVNEQKRAVKPTRKPRSLLSLLGR